MCFVFIWEETANCATYSINWLVSLTEMKSVYRAVRTGSLNKAVCSSYLKFNGVGSTFRRKKWLPLWEIQYDGFLELSKPQKCEDTISGQIKLSYKTKQYEVPGYCGKSWLHLLEFSHATHPPPNHRTPIICNFSAACNIAIRCVTQLARHQSERCTCSLTHATWPASSYSDYPQHVD